MKNSCALLFITLNALLAISLAKSNYCKDWTLCQRVLCLNPPDPCPADKPYLLYGECGCCQYCSETPRIGPCGQCGKDVICKEGQPICDGDNQVTTLDYCGCCKVCKKITGPGSKCRTHGPSSTVCDAGLRCINGTCQVIF